MSTNNHRNEIYDLIFASLSGIASEQQQKQLAQILEEDINLRSDYVDFLMTYTLLHRRSGATVFAEDMKEPVLDQKLWESLAYEEKTAPVIEMPRKEELQRDAIQKVEYPAREKRKISKFNLFFLAMNTAAVLFIVIFLKLVPPDQSVEVATVIDSVDAKWAGITFPMENGTRVSTGGDSFLLREGFAELEFDNKAKVTLEGPAEFQILAADRIGLNYGKVYTTVPKEATGFSVYTQNAKIIDLGTEFGVQSEISGDTELHVLKGRTLLMAGEKADRVNLEVDEGVAKQIAGVNGTVSDIECDNIKFARRIIPDGKRIWRGKNLSLASIIAGYDGFHDISSLIGLNPASGEFVTSILGDARASKSAYHLVPDSKFIDGVFVPDGGQGPIPVTSAGHTFDCPNTSGLFTHEIASYKGAIESYHTTIPPAVFNGRKHEKSPVVLLHSNIGITFDLQKIRGALAGLDIKSFAAVGALTENVDESEEPDIDFWVLVDGQIRYEKQSLKLDDGFISFDVELTLQDRFLTLIVTDGLRVTDGKREYPYGNDFFYLIDPELSLEKQ